MSYALASKHHHLRHAIDKIEHEQEEHRGQGDRPPLKSPSELPLLLVKIRGILYLWHFLFCFFWDLVLGG
ncbi:hypothetical protein K3G39_06250 [Pontibacter sp. HSC-14F20]|uniref:hypothetical protein n=1 Tax=Pontibacter sp. HSC-14F20 TaxID=2864136 RepID=UPI001C73B1BB|nr:hypothetical protein [Pontibacter sp. HSC-14F20]MBX0332832.1 hypothetical protein [Pontibacter sp. HSC-14F20]